MTAPLPNAFRAAWIYPVVEAPVRNGIIDVDGNGSIIGIRSSHDDDDAIDLGDVALVPGLINAHVHLEFSDLPRPIEPPSPFPDWVKNVVAHRRQRREPLADILRRGLEEVRRSGTIAVGEISTSDELDAYGASGITATVFRELIGPKQDGWKALLAEAERHLIECHGRPGVRGGLSPHAPYTAPQELFERAVELAVRYAAPVAVHLAETTAERELFAEGTGELVEMMRSLDLWEPAIHPAGRRPLDWLRSLSRCNHGLVIHGNSLDDEELDLIAANPNLSLIYCPRTHAFFGHRPHPFRSLLDRGGRVSIGTDGRSSNPDLDLWNEARFLRRRHPDLASGTILRLVTLSGAEALGIDDQCGALSPGRRADFLVIRLNDLSSSEPPELFSDRNTVCRVFRGGIDAASHDNDTSCHA